MKQIHFRFPISDFRFPGWKPAALLLFLAFTRAALGTSSGYTNNAQVFFDGFPAHTMPAGFNPTIDATNFVNNNQFEIFNGSTYQTWNTTNFVNNSLMVGYVGFWFDTHTASQTPDVWAAGFYNPGQIYAQNIVKVWATNILNPGLIEIGDGTLGTVQLAGKNVDLTRATIAMNGGAQLSGQIFGISPTVGSITNNWFPSINLAMPNPFTPPFPVPPGLFKSQIFLFNPVVYANDTGVVNSNRVVQVVYISQPNPAIGNNVAFNPTNVIGGITVQFNGAYVNPATGLFSTNYLLISDDFGEITNLQVAGAAPFIFPVNYSFSESSSPILTNAPPPIGLPPGIYGNAATTNTYSYVQAEFAPTTVSTNNIANGSVTNLPSALRITADNLDLTLANLFGMNYLSLTVTNQFNDDDGAQVVAPYADLNLGVTNGMLTVSNLLAPAIPVWSGQCLLWSARWQIVDSSGVTNNYHVLFVDSPELSAFASAQVVNLTLHATNSLVISDVYNIMNAFYADAQNLTLTTNGFGEGATSLEGELNLDSSGIFWQTSLPFLRNLTNNGAITTMNLALFGGDAPVYITNSIPDKPAVAATGTLSEVSGRTNVTVNSKVTIGTNQYVFATRITNTVPNQIKIAVKFDGTISNLIAAINHAAGSGVNYSTNTRANPLIAAGLLTNHAFVVTAKTAGSAGNLIATTTTSTNLTWNGASTLSGGADFVAGSTNVSAMFGRYGAFINGGSVLNEGGSTIWADNFENSGSFSSGAGSFNLQTLTTTLAGGSLNAGGNVSINADTLLASNVMVFAGGALNLTATNLLTDTGVANGNFWLLGSSAASGSPGIFLNNGFNLPIKPAMGDLLGTTVYSVAPAQFVLGGVTNNNVRINNLWAATNSGVSTAGYQDNAAVGRLFLDAQAPGGTFYFSGVGVSNALYVDDLELLDFAANFDGTHVNALLFNTNLVIYYAQARANGAPVAEKLNGLNANHLRWVPAYAGFFSSTNIVYPDGTTNTVNAALAQSTTLDSDGDGIANANDPTPLFLPDEWDVAIVITNLPPPTAWITWHSIPSATNYVNYTTNMVNWLPLTNFISPSLVPPAGGWPITNLVSDPVGAGPMRMYQVLVYPNSATQYGP